MSSIDVMVATPGDEASGKGLSALIHGLKEMDQVALVRYVPRKNASPQVGILYPVIHSTHECLYWAAIPFAEDVRYTIIFYPSYYVIPYNHHITVMQL